MSELTGFLFALAALLCAGPLLAVGSRNWRMLQSFLRQSAQEDWGSLFLFLDGTRLALVYAGSAVTSLTILVAIGVSGPGLVLGIGAALLMPRTASRILRRRRETQLTRQLPDTLLGLANAMRSGAGFQVALELSVREGLPPLSQELAIILKELRMGSSMTTAFQNFETRYPTEEIRLLVAAVTINREVGGSLSDILLSLGETLRRKLDMRGKIEALTAQGRMQGYVMTALPGLIALAIYQFEPHAMATLCTTVWGWLVLGIASLMLILGSVFIRKIVNIDV